VQKNKMRYIKPFTDIRAKDVPLVGGKTASLGEMMHHLRAEGILIPDGFAITSDAYWHYIQSNQLQEKINAALTQLVHHDNDVQTVQRVGATVRNLIENASMPHDLADEIERAYEHLSVQYQCNNVDVAVRSSATAEDLPGASFAGQQETYLNIHGVSSLLVHCKKSFASLFTDRALVYRMAKGFSHTKVALSIAVQKMVRSDLACSGVAFSVDTDTGFKDVVLINASWGLGETIVQGLVTPDEYVVYKPFLETNYVPIIQKRSGDKDRALVYSASQGSSVLEVDVPHEKRKQLCLVDTEILTLAKHVACIERYYSMRKGSWCPMDIEWAKDGNDGTVYIVQARPETIISQQSDLHAITVYELDKKGDSEKPIATGQSIGSSITAGTARVVRSIDQSDVIKEGDIIITEMTDPSWVPIMKRAAGIVTNRGGRTCHAAIVSRELGIPAIVGVEDATGIIKNNQEITLDCSRGTTGYVYAGRISYTKKSIGLDTIPKLPVQLLLNTADPAQAFVQQALPVEGVGLCRTEFIIANNIGIHPMALLYPERIVDTSVLKEIALKTSSYSDNKAFFVDTLAQGIGTIAAAFYPRPVTVRFSDFKSHEYRGLLGGSYFEVPEENPMLGFRGASRYYHAHYKEAFALECAALKKVREIMGFANVQIMIPFVRTLDEAAIIIDVLKENGLVRGAHGLTILMMVETPANVVLIRDFSHYFDGFSIGSNDLAQLTLGIDRDSALIAPLFDERNQAVKALLLMAIEGAHAHKKKIGICGQAPSDYPELAAFLMSEGIDSLSLNADAIIPFLMRYQEH
jgi:pyruvate,water dikinase